MSTTNNHHGCRYQWCEQSGSQHEEHLWTLGYTPASMGTVAPENISPGGVDTMTVGVGLRYDEIKGSPAVFVHLYDGDRDVDAFLRVDEADFVVGALQDAVGMCREIIAAGTPLPKGVA